MVYLLFVINVCERICIKSMGYRKYSLRVSLTILLIIFILDIIPTFFFFYYYE